MDIHAGRTVSDATDGYRLIETRFENHPRAGDEAPDFELRHYRGEETLRLSSFRGETPVVLVFGSLT